VRALAGLTDSWGCELVWAPDFLVSEQEVMLHSSCPFAKYIASKRDPNRVNLYSNWQICDIPQVRSPRLK